MFSLCCFLPSTSGRAPETKALGLDKLGVELKKETGKIILGSDESTSVPNIYAFGDIGEVGVVDGDTTLTAETAHNTQKELLLVWTAK